MEQNINSELLSVFTALANETRLLVIQSLIREESCCSDLANKLNLSQPNLTQHCNILRRSGLIAEEKIGTTKILSVNKSKLKEAAELMGQLLVKDGVE